MTLPNINPDQPLFDKTDSELRTFINAVNLTLAGVEMCRKVINCVDAMDSPNASDLSKKEDALDRITDLEDLSDPNKGVANNRANLEKYDVISGQIMSIYSKTTRDPKRHQRGWIFREGYDPTSGNV